VGLCNNPDTVCVVTYAGSAGEMPWGKVGSGKQ
jgi:hypothetical protein